MKNEEACKDTQIVELVGKHYLTAELLDAGLEVAFPIRDRGIDMIAYVDTDKKVGCFSSFPIQMKASLKHSFCIDKKYQKFHNLILVFVWNLADYKSRVVYALTYEEAHCIAEKIGWTKTDSWILKNKYANTNPSAKLVSLLKPYEMSAKRWREKILRMMSYEEREIQKQSGWNLYNNNSSPDVRARGLMMIIEAHYHRNPEAPSLSEYAAHWLCANAGQYDSKVLDVLLPKYPAPKQPRIKKEYTDWGSINNACYKE